MLFYRTHTHTYTQRQTTLLWLIVLEVEGLRAVLGDGLLVRRVPEVAQGIICEETGSACVHLSGILLIM